MPAQLPKSPALTFAHAKDEPIVFYGPPGRLRGVVHVRNASDEKVKLTALPLQRSTLPATARQATAISLGARLYPNRDARLSAALALDPRTPPGTYEASVDVGEGEQPVRLHVVEHVDLRIEPQQVFIYTDGELTFQRELVAENAGNVPLELGRQCIVPLGDLTDLRLALRGGLKGACDAKESDDVMKAFFCALSREQVGDLSITREPITLAPGETISTIVTFQLPENIRKFRRYVVQLPLYNAVVQVEIVTQGMLGGKKAPERTVPSPNKERTAS